MGLQEVGDAPTVGEGVGGEERGWAGTQRLPDVPEVVAKPG